MRYLVFGTTGLLCGGLVGLLSDSPTPAVWGLSVGFVIFGLALAGLSEFNDEMASD